MNAAILAVGWLEAAAFTVLALITIADWIRHRGLQRQYLAWAIGLLALLTLTSRFNNGSGIQPRWLEAITVPVFLGSGYALMLVRHSFIPMRRRTLTVLAGIVIFVSAILVALPQPTSQNNIPPLYLVASIGFILLWIGFIMEPVIRFWTQSRHRPLVQRARMRALSLGYGSIVAIVFVAIGVAIGAGIKSQTSPQSQALQLSIGIVVLAIIPLLYVGFVPPGWVRRFWRAREEAALRTATSELLTEEDPDELARLALSWAMRLSGADAGLIAGRTGQVLAAEKLTPELQEQLQQLEPGTSARLAPVMRGDSRTLVIVAPLQVREAYGFIAVVGGPFTPVFGQDEVERLGSYGVDVGAAIERVDLVRQLARRAFELERSNQALQEFAYIASHDLQEPLRMVASYLQLLRSRYHEKLDADADEFINYAVDGARRMQSLIDDLLEYSRVGTKQEPMKPTSLTEVMATTAMNLRTTIEESGATVIVSAMPTVVGDEGQLVQLTQNLVANAIKFHGLVAPEVHVDAHRGKGEWDIIVSDNGIGIEPRHADRIFQIFRRLHPANEYPGTGIGLAICRKIVERHGGRIWVESDPGHGAAFHFTLPDTPPVQPKEDSNGSGRRDVAELVVAAAGAG